MPANSARFGQGIFGQCVFGDIYEELTATLDNSATLLNSAKDVNLSSTLQTVATMLLGKIFELSATLNLSHAPLIDKLMLLSDTLNLSHLGLVDKPVEFSATMNTSHGIILDKPVNLSATLNPSYQSIIDKIIMASASLKTSTTLTADKALIILDTVHLADIAYKLINEIEVISEGWSWWYDETAPSSTPISGHSDPHQAIYDLLLSKSYGWFDIWDLVPVLDVVVTEGAVRETSIIVDLPANSEKNIVQYLGSEDDLLLLRLHGGPDMMRMLKALNKNDYITLQIRMNATNWWVGRVRFLDFDELPSPAEEELRVVEAFAKGTASSDTVISIGEFMANPPTQDKYNLILLKSHGWGYIISGLDTSEGAEELVDSEEP